MPVRRNHSLKENDREQQAGAASAKRRAATLSLVKNEGLQDSHKAARPGADVAYPELEDYARAETLRRASGLAAVAAAAIAVVLLGLVVVGTII